MDQTASSLSFTGKLYLHPVHGALVIHKDDRYFLPVPQQYRAMIRILLMRSISHDKQGRILVDVLRERAQKEYFADVLPTQCSVFVTGSRSVIVWGHTGDDLVSLSSNDLRVLLRYIQTPRSLMNPQTSMINRVEGWLYRFMYEQLREHASYAKAA